MVEAERAVLRALMKELSGWAQRRETDPSLLNPRAARRVRARIAELELMVLDEDEAPMNEREFAHVVGESRALLEDEPGPPVDGRIPPEDSGPVRLRAEGTTEKSGVHAAMAQRARAALDED